MSLKKHIPNAFTCANLLCGCVALIQAFEGQLIVSAYLVGMALIFDFFDGFIARLLHVSSPIGKDLDSLADMVTFGVVPGMVMYQLITQATVVDGPASEGWTIYAPATSNLPYLALVIPLLSCIRLAKFNNDTRQSDSFIGLPTPANAMVLCSLPLILHYQGAHVLFLLNPYLLVLMSFALSLLLIAEIPLFALKFKGFSWADRQNRLRFLFLGIAVVLLLLLHFVAIPLIILLYILLSIVNNIFLKKKV